MPFTHRCFQTYDMEKIPVHDDLFLMDVVWLQEWEKEWIAVSEGNGGDPYTVGFISRASAASVRESGIELCWYPNTHDRFHEVKILLPRDAFIAAVTAWEYERRLTIFVKSGWLRQLHLRANSVFAMIDASGMTKEIEAGRISRDKLISLRDHIDEIAARHPDISFISFADSLLLKTNWVVGIRSAGIMYNYRPETLLLLFRELRAAYKAVLNLDIYGVFAQGSNEYYDDALLHVSNSKNHICLNSLGLPFAQIMLIEAAARAAIRKGEHGQYELYMDADFFRSLQFTSYRDRESVRSARYMPKMTTEPGIYFYNQCDALLGILEVLS